HRVQKSVLYICVSFSVLHIGLSLPSFQIPYIFLVSLVCMPRSGIAGSYGSSISTSMVSQCTRPDPLARHSGGYCSAPLSSQSLMVYPPPDVLIPPRKDVLLFWLRNITIGLTVFVVKKKYIFHLKLFLEMAEMYFMVGHRVNYYIFTDRPDYVPRIPLQKGLQMVIFKVQRYARWQKISIHCMEVISNFIEQRFHQEVDYLVCANVDMKFSDDVGVEIISSLFSTLHPGFYGLTRKYFEYEHQPQSQAHIPEDKGEFYYIGGYHEAMMVDQANHIEATQNDESHLNKYLLYHKPTKILSPEYMLDSQIFNYLEPNQVQNLVHAVHRIFRPRAIPSPSLPPPITIWLAWFLG
ncbi:hypothetical protein FD754_013623, partial [Muntiacus muntjak]